MNITITNLDKRQDIVYVSFECAQGQGRGIWRGENAEIGSTTYVEFDIEELLAITKFPMAEKRYAIEFAAEVASITGDILTIEDEVVFFRFAETIIQLDGILEAIEIGEWVIVSVMADNFLIYPVNL